jgi:hypothetical protein
VQEPKPDIFEMHGGLVFHPLPRQDPPRPVPS